MRSTSSPGDRGYPRRPERLAAASASWLILTGLLLQACAGEHSLVEPIRIGMITSLTGDLASRGPGRAKAAKLALREANAGGGALGGRPFELLIEDDRTDAIGGEEAARALMAEGVVGVIGALASSSSLAAAQILGPAEIPQISGSSTSPSLNADQPGGGEAHPYFFRTVPADQLQGVVLSALAYGQFNGPSLDFSCRSLAVIYIDNAYGQPFGDVIQNRFTGLGGSIAVAVPYEEGLPSYSPLVDQVREADPDCIALVGYVETGATIVREWYYRGGAALPWFGTDGVRDQAFVDAIGVESVGFTGTVPASDAGRVELQDFVAYYQAVYNEEPVTFAQNFYDAAALMVLAILQAKSTAGADIREALFSVSSFETGDENIGPGDLLEGMNSLASDRRLNYIGASGNVDFLVNGDVLGDFEVWTWTGTEFATLRELLADDILDSLSGQ